MKKTIAFILVLVLVAFSNIPALAEIKKGSKGNDVIELQERLIELGYLHDTADGSFGNKTQTALEAFQEANGLEVTGVANISDITLLFSDAAIPVGGSAEASDAQTNSEKTNSAAEPIFFKTSDTVVIKDSDYDLQITNAGCSLDSGYLYYSIIIHNNSDTLAYEFPNFRITARDSSGSLLGSTDQTCNIIYPEQDLYWTGLGFEVSEPPAVVEFEMTQPDDYNIVPASSLTHPEYIPLEIRGVNKDGTRILGEVYNPNDYDIGTAAVLVLFRNDNGELIGGDLTFIESLRAGDTTPFDMSVYVNFATDDYVVYAYTWD